MQPSCTVQLHHQGHWHDVASVRLLGAPAEGWRAATHAGYAVDWAVSHGRARDAHAVAAAWPVGLDLRTTPHWPVWLIDLLPQGHGRQEMLRRIGVPEHTGLAADWALLQVGAGNPIGHLRVKEAADWLATQDSPPRGFADDEVAARGEGFAEHLASHGLFVAGSSGVQGEWPKILLTRADDGLLYLDHTLPDARAVAHYIVKFGRGTDERLATILRHEAPYMAIAGRLGLRVHAPLQLRQRALFIPRFDRRAQPGAGVLRLAQESVASLTQMPGFDLLPSHDQVCAALIRHCSDPQTELLEYLRRDVANLALLNKDNHARNTAVQRGFDGHVALTPLFDFAPMYLHPDGIARRMRWDGNDHLRVDWGRVLDRVCTLAEEAAGTGQRRPRRRGATAVPAVTREALVGGLKAMVPALRAVAHEAEAIGLEPEVARFLQPHLLGRADELDALR